MNQISFFFIIYNKLNNIYRTWSPNQTNFTPTVSHIMTTLVPTHVKKLFALQRHGTCPTTPYTILKWLYFIVFANLLLKIFGQISVDLLSKKYFNLNAASAISSSLSVGAGYSILHLSHTYVFVLIVSIFMLVLDSLHQIWISRSESWGYDNRNSRFDWIDWS